MKVLNRDMSTTKTKVTLVASPVKVPADLDASLKSNKKALALWDDLTPVARRDWISWVTSAKQEATRRRRIEQTNSKLLSGKRRPCCFAVIPMTLYTALGTNPAAKAKWKELSPDARRDVAEWIESPEYKGKKVDRVNEACVMIAKGNSFR